MLTFLTKNPFKKVFKPFAKKEDLYRISVEKKFDRTIYTPQIKKGDSRFNRWERIVCVYGRYYIMELEEESKLSSDECREHIWGFQDQTAREKNMSRTITEYIPVEIKN
jgi:hypothetical protein